MSEPHIDPREGYEHLWQLWSGPLICKNCGVGIVAHVGGLEAENAALLQRAERLEKALRDMYDAASDDTHKFCCETMEGPRLRAEALLTEMGAEGK